MALKMQVNSRTTDYARSIFSSSIEKHSIIFLLSFVLSWQKLIVSPYTSIVIDNQMSYVFFFLDTSRAMGLVRL